MLVKHLFKEKKGSRYVTDSLKLAEWCNKRHSSLLRDTRNVISSYQFEGRDDFVNSNFLQSTYTDKNNQKRPRFLFSKEGALALIQSFQRSRRFPYSKREEALSYLKSLGVSDIEVFWLTKKPKESKFVEDLKKFLKPLNIRGKRQFKVLTYFIDFYIPSLNVAIEYDENSHKNYDLSKEILREKRISKELGCSFIRVSDSHSNSYNLGVVAMSLFGVD